MTSSDELTTDDITEAMRIIELLTERAIERLPGYFASQGWRAPAPDEFAEIYLVGLTADEAIFASDEQYEPYSRLRLPVSLLLG